jgi:2-keto-4-pentenoate hydratase/2-oxohepta-3-ene-1,7-dioic acid hydratase in catechol pathway
MQYVRAGWHGRTIHGFVKDDEIEVYCCDAIADPQASPTGERVKLADARLLAPCAPSKVVAIGINYRDHADEMGHDLPDDPVIFIKPSTSVIGPGDAIEIGRASCRERV